MFYINIIMQLNISKKMPIAVSGLLLAILSLGNLYNNPFIKVFTFVLGVIIILLLLAKLCFYRDIFRNELCQLVVMSTSGTFSMALMTLSTYIVTFNYQLALITWLLGVLLHICLIIVFTYKYILHNFDIEEVYGSYWIVYIGITMASISGLSLNLQSISWIFFVFGFIIMIPTFLLVTYRYLKYPVKLEQNKPLICIYAAIFNILIVGYLHSFTDIQYIFLIILYLVATICYVFSLYNLIKLLRMKFYPSYSAFTFPFVISAIASKEVLKLIPSAIIQYLLYFEIIIATIMVVYVLYMYMKNIVIKNL